MSDRAKRQAEALFARKTAEPTVERKPAAEVGAGVMRRHDAPATWSPIADLVELPGNAKLHPPEQLEVLQRLIRRYGWTRPVVARKGSGEILMGHGAVAAMRELLAGSPAHRLPGAPKAGLIPVRFVEVPDEEASTLAMLDNLSAELGSWDAVAVAEAMQEAEQADDELQQLVADAWDEDELASLIGETTTTAPAPTGAGDNTPPPPEEALPALPESELGQIYQLGPHRLLVADSTDPETIAKLLGELDAARWNEPVKPAAVITDPPFAIYGSSTGLAADITDDKVVRPFFREVLRRCHELLPVFGVAYVFCDWRSWPSWWEVSRDTGLAPKNLIVWDKGKAGLGTHWLNCYELTGYFVKLQKQKTMRDSRASGMHKVSKPNVQRHDRVPTSKRESNAVKPLSLLAEYIDAAPPDGVIVDLFGGSGSTLIACADAERRCMMVEIEPRMADVIRRRWTRWADEQGVDPGPGALRSE